MHLNLADQQLGVLLKDIPTACFALLKDTFFTYRNPTYEIKIQYPCDWTIDDTSYPAGKVGVQIAAFYLPNI